MKHTIAFLLFVSLLLPGGAHAALSPGEKQEIISQIQSLLDLVRQLQAQLIALQAQVPAVQTPPVVSPTWIDFTVPHSVPQPNRVSVTMKDSDVQIENTSPVPVRISRVGLDEGEVKSLSFGSVTYQAVFSVAGPASYRLFDCAGLGSLGVFPAPGAAKFDPCARPNERFPKNELKPGERVVIHTTGRALVKDATTIVESLTGKPVEF